MSFLKDKSLLKISHRLIESDLYKRIQKQDEDEAMAEAEREREDNEWVAMQDMASVMDMRIVQNIDFDGNERYDIFVQDHMSEMPRLLQSFGSKQEAYECIRFQYSAFNRNLESQSEQSQSQSMREQQ